MEHSETIKYRGTRTIGVRYSRELDGGGSRFGQQFHQALRLSTGRVTHIFELCAGPGFIGFSLLAQGLCERLTLADINPRAVEACRRTIEDNGLENCCAVHQSDVLNEIPPHDPWDLVVGNPPHWPEGDRQSQSGLLRVDPDLSLHRRFFESVGPHLQAGGSILLQENSEATSPDSFSKMIVASGFTTRRVFVISHSSPFYFLWCTRA